MVTKKYDFKEKHIISHTNFNMSTILYEHFSYSYKYIYSIYQFLLNYIACRPYFCLDVLDA